MLGLIVAVIYGLCLYLFGSPNTFPEIFLGATNLLFWWYVVVYAILGVIAILIALGMIGGGTIVGALSGGILGAILGFITGGALSTLILLAFVIKAGCLIGGAYLLHNAVIITPTGVPAWDTIKLIFGIVLLLIGLTKTRSSRSSS